LKRSFLLSSLVLLALSIIASYLAVNYVWVTVMLAAGIAYGSLAPIIASRRLYFLAGAAPHAAFLAAVMGIPLSRVIGLDPYILAIITGLVLVYVIGVAVHRGADPDIATSVFVAFTASATVIAVYFTLSAFPLETDITAIVVGDPLLATPREAIGAVALAVACLLGAGLTYCEQACIGVDPDTARLSGLRIWVYDLVLFTLLALSTVALVKIVGFVLEHVLILLPASIAVTSAWSARSTFIVSLLSSIAASLFGLYLALVFNQAPAGIAGLSLLAVYASLILFKKK